MHGPGSPEVRHRERSATQLGSFACGRACIGVPCLSFAAFLCMLSGAGHILIHKQALPLRSDSAYGANTSMYLVVGTCLCRAVAMEVHIDAGVAIARSRRLGLRAAISQDAPGSVGVRYQEAPGVTHEVRFPEVLAVLATVMCTLGRQVFIIFCRGRNGLCIFRELCSSAAILDQATLAGALGRRRVPSPFASTPLRWRRLRLRARSTRPRRRLRPLLPSCAVPVPSGVAALLCACRRLAGPSVAGLAIVVRARARLLVELLRLSGGARLSLWLRGILLLVAARGAGEGASALPRDCAGGLRPCSPPSVPIVARQSLFRLWFRLSQHRHAHGQIVM